MREASPGTWAQEVFGGAEFRDRRWQKRLVLVAARAARRPGGKVTEVISSAAERQGAYGLLESNAVTASQVAAGMFNACGRRAASEPFVFCPVDGSSLNLTDLSGTKGFGSIGARSRGAVGLKVINALVLSPQGVPVGLSGQVWWARSMRRVRKHRARRSPAEKEIRHWTEAMEQTRQTMGKQAPYTRVWFQLDREGDAWPILEQADAGGHWFTIRGNHNRRVILPDGSKTYLRDLLRLQPVLARYRLSVSAGPSRRERKADMHIRAHTATLDFLDKRTGRRFTKVLHAVLAQEVGTTPAGEKPLEWLLLTNRPVDTEGHLLQIIYGYSLRWRIEDLHRTWKSGACRVEESQLRSKESVIKWATILAAVAVRIERIKLLSRKEPDRLATDEFSAAELRAITLLRFGKAAKQRFPDGVSPTLAEATQWLAQIGGYTGKSSGGPPGSVVLARGLHQVEIAVRAIEAMDQE